MKSFYTYLFFFIFVCNVSAQNKQLRAYTQKDGLSQSQVYDIIQDEKGYLWLGTQGGGLCNFDGENFKIWNEENGLQSNYIHTLKAKNDTLYIGTNRGLSIKIKNKFLNVEAPKVNHIFFSEDNKYIATKEGVYEISEALTLNKISINPEIDANSVNTIIYKNSFFWVATNKGFWQLSELSKAAKTQIKLEANNFTALASFNDKIIAATFNDGTSIYNVNDLENPFLIKEPLSINHISIQNNNELWVSTCNDGITVIDAETFNEKTILNTKKGFSVPHIRKAIHDENGNIWIATSGGGFYKYFQNNFKHYNDDTGLKGNRVYAIHQAKKGLWLSNSEKGLVKIDSLGVHLIPQAKDFLNVKIKTITSDAKGNIWAGSEDRGLLYREEKTVDTLIIDSTDVFNIKEELLTKTKIKNHVLNTDNGFPNDWIRKIILHDNAIYAATYSSGIIKFKYNAENEELDIIKIFGEKDGIEDLLIKDMVKDSKNQLWYATQNGHLGYIKNDSINHLGQVLNTKIPIGSLLFNNDNLFLGTAGRGIWWSKTDNITFKKLKGKKRLYSQNVYQLIFDNQGYLWVGSERGIDKIKLDQENNIEDRFHFGRNDGFLGIETCLNAVEKDNKGNLWFGALFGATEYSPSLKTRTYSKPNIYFSDVKVAYKSIDSIPLKTWTNTSNVLQLKPKQKHISFSYKTIDLDHPKEVQYRTKLNDLDWSPWTYNNISDFTGLSYGNHKFMAQSRNYRWLESNPVSFSFYIDSPLYKKTWFQWLVLLLSIIALTTLALVYIKKLKKENKKEREYLKMQNHLLSLEQKALRLQMNPHFIFNVLNGIKAMAVNKPEKMNATINNFATLLRETLINSRKDYISLDQEIKTLSHYIEVEKLMAPKTFNYQIKVNSELDTEEILVPPMLIQPFVENAIRHGILKGKKDGELSVEFSTNTDFLMCTIKDNGIGIFTSQENKPKTDHQSMALTVTRERLESISGKDALEISEIKNNNGTIDGTIITFKIPIETDF